MPARFGHVGIGAREQHRRSRRGAPTWSTPSGRSRSSWSPSRVGARRERREVGAGARLAEQLAPHLFVAHDRRQEAQPLLLGAVREQRGRRQVEPERVEPAEVERRELLLDPARDAPATDRARRTRPARSARRGPSRRTPDTTLVVGAGPHAAHRGRAARAAGVDPRAAARWPRSTRAPRRPRRLRSVCGPIAEPRCRSRSLSARRTAARRCSRNAAMPSRKSSRARRELERERLVAELLLERRVAPGVQQPLREPERRRSGPTASCATRSRRPRRRARRRDTAAWIAPHAAASAPRELGRPSSSSSRAAHLADPARQQPGGAAVGREPALARTAPRTSRRRPRS